MHAEREWYLAGVGRACSSSASAASSSSEVSRSARALASRSVASCTSWSAVARFISEARSDESAAWSECSSRRAPGSSATPSAATASCSAYTSCIRCGHMRAREAGPTPATNQTTTHLLRLENLDPLSELSCGARRSLEPVKRKLRPELLTLREACRLGAHLRDPCVELVESRQTRRHRRHRSRRQQQAGSHQLVERVRAQTAACGGCLRGGGIKNSARVLHSSNSCTLVLSDLAMAIA